MTSVQISDEIRTLLKDPIDKQKIRLTFTYGDKEYSTAFVASHNGDNVKLHNLCISLRQEPFLYGEISANSVKKGCFNPILISNSRNKQGERMTSTDILQILKTKLALTFPFTGPIVLDDLAQKDGIMISPFRILRGQDAVYEKYGYTSEIVTRVKEGISKMSWGDLDEMQKGYITEIIGKPKKTWKVWKVWKAVEAFDGTEKLTDIMKTISWDMEKEHIKLNGSPISEMVFRLFAPTFGYRLQDFNQLADISIWSFTLDKESPSWIESDTKLQFTKLEMIRGGKRMQKSKKTRKLRKNTK